MTKISLPPQLRKDQHRLFSPNEHFEQQVEKLQSRVQERINQDPFCKRGAGLLIPVDDLEDAAIDRFVQNIDELCWLVERGHGSDHILISPAHHVSMSILRSRITSAISGHNFDHGELRVSVWDFDNSVVEGMFNALTSYHWSVKKEVSNPSEPPVTSYLIIRMPEQPASEAAPQPQDDGTDAPTSDWMQSIISSSNGADKTASAKGLDAPAASSQHGSPYLT